MLTKEGVVGLDLQSVNEAHEARWMENISLEVTGEGEMDGWV